MHIVLAIQLLFLAAPADAPIAKDQAAALRKRIAVFAHEKNAEGIGGVIRELEKFDDAEALRLVLHAAAVLPSAANTKAAVERVVALEDERTLADLVAWLDKGKGDYRERLILIDALASRKDAASLRAILEQLRSKDQRTTLAAIQAAGRRRSPESVAALIDLLERIGSSHDRVWYETRNALLELTGQDFDAVDDWKTYWEGMRAKFAAAAAEKEAESRKRTIVARGEVDFFGKAVYSRNIIFVIDTSSSMLKWDASEAYKGPNPERDQQRLRRAKKELFKALGALPPEARFNVIAYSEEVVPWSRVLVKASRGNVEKAAAFVQEFKPEGATHTDEALVKAFEDPWVDTIVLLSDGAPSKKGETNALGTIEEILRWLEDANAVRKIRIDTFGFTGPGHWPEDLGGRQAPPPPSEFEAQTFVDFLQSLATRTGGSFHAID